MTELQGKVAIVLLAALVVSVGFDLAGYSLTSRAWEYRIESIADAKWQSTMAALGDQGWELASARRAVRGEGDASEGLYECIFKRQKALVRVAESGREKTPADRATDELHQAYERGQQGR